MQVAATGGGGSDVVLVPPPQADNTMVKSTNAIDIHIVEFFNPLGRRLFEVFMLISISDCIRYVAITRQAGGG
jgi:hypothetical protein